MTVAVRTCKNLFGAVISSKTSTSTGIRFLSTNPEKASRARQLTVFDIDNQTGIASLSMNNPPVNALTLELLSQLRSDLKEAERNKVRGLVIMSSLEKMFSAGFNVAELHTTNRDFLTELISLGQDVTEAVHSFPFPTAALINGHALGGGCGLAACCEYRAMMPNYRIGMVEVAVGVVPQDWVHKFMLEILDRRIAELALTQAKQFNTDEALKIGLIDDIVSDKKEGLVKIQKFINSFRGINPVARATTKKLFRFKLFNDKQADAKAFVDELLQPHVQQTIGAYLKALKKKSKS